jgi:kinesin family protein 18/19
VELRESPTKGVFLAGASEVIISCERDANKLLKKVTSRRQTQATQANESSSRSHAIIQICIEQKERCQGLQQ